MTYGLQVYTSSGKVSVDPDQLPTTLIGTFLTSGNSGSVTYPQLAGSSVYAVPIYQTNLTGSQFLQFSVDYNLGYPRVNWANTYADARYTPFQEKVYVFLKKS